MICSYVLSSSLLLASCSSLLEYQIEGRLADHDIKTTADSEIAKYYLEKYQNGAHSNPQYEKREEGNPF
jgi:hypothetical protein